MVREQNSAYGLLPNLSTSQRSARTFPSIATAARTSRWASTPWLTPLLAALLALLATVPALFGPDDSLYPVQADSLKYHNMGRGLALFIEELPSAFLQMARGEFDDEDRLRYGMDGPILQHAASYIALLGSTYVVSGGTENSGRLLSSLLFAGSAALLTFWTRRHFGMAAALLFIPIFILWPAHLRFGTAIMTEIPMVFFMAASAVCLDLTRAPARSALGALGGIVLGFLSLAKVTFRFVIAPVLALDVWAARGQGRRAWLRFASWRIGGVILVVVIWGVFLRMAGLSANPVSESGEQELWIFRGNYVSDRGFETVGLGDVATPELLKAIRENENLPEEEKQKAIYRRAFSLVVQKDPVRWAALVLAKVRWFWIYPAVKEDVIAWWGRIPPPAHLQTWVVILALVGVAAALRRGPASWIPAALAAYLCAVHAATHLVSRYGIPSIALAMPYASFGVVSVAQLLARWRWRDSESPQAPKVRRSRGKNRPDSKDRAGGRNERRNVLGSIAVAFVIGLLALIGRDLIIGLGFSVRTACRLESAFGMFAILAWGAPVWLLLRRGGWTRIGAGAALAILFVIPSVTFLAERHVDFDPDVWKARLSKPGDRIVQTIALPPKMDWRPVRAAEIQIDMLGSAENSSQLTVLVNGREVHQYERGLESGAENFLVDENIHAVQARYARVRNTVADHLAGFVQPRHPNAGYEYYRQWFRIPVPLDLLSGSDSVSIELVREGGDGWIDVYGDHGLSTRGQRRILFAPAFMSNPFELSNYQFQLFASDREKADARFIRPLSLLSPGTRAEFLREGRSFGSDLSPSRGRQGGEFRIRLRAQLRGGYVSRPDPENPEKKKSVWAVWPASDDVITENDTIRLLSARRDNYVDGWQTY